MNSYHERLESTANDDGVYKEGDFILNFGDCNLKDRNCEIEMRPKYSQSLQSLSPKQRMNHEHIYKVMVISNQGTETHSHINVDRETAIWRQHYIP